MGEKLFDSTPYEWNEMEVSNRFGTQLSCLSPILSRLSDRCLIEQDVSRMSSSAAALEGRGACELLNELVAHDAVARCVSIGPLTGTALATGGDDCALHVWHLGRPTVMMTSRDFKRAVTAVAFGPAEGHLAAGSEGGVVKIISLSSQKGA